MEIYTSRNSLRLFNIYTGQTVYFIYTSRNSLRLFNSNELDTVNEIYTSRNSLRLFNANWWTEFIVSTLVEIL